MAVSKKTAVRIGDRETHADFVSEGRGSSNFEVSVGFKTSVTSQPLAPIGTPSMNSEGQSDMRSQKLRYINDCSTSPTPFPSFHPLPPLISHCRCIFLFQINQMNMPFDRAFILHSSLQVGSSAGQNLGTGLIFESKNKPLDNFQTSLDAWGNSGINQQVHQVICLRSCKISSFEVLYIFKRFYIFENYFDI